MQRSDGIRSTKQDDKDETRQQARGDASYPGDDRTERRRKLKSSRGGSGFFFSVFLGATDVLSGTAPPQKFKSSKMITHPVDSAIELEYDVTTTIIKIVQGISSLFHASSILGVVWSFSREV